MEQQTEAKKKEALQKVKEKYLAPLTQEVKNSAKAGHETTIKGWSIKQMDYYYKVTFSYLEDGVPNDYIWDIDFYGKITAQNMLSQNL